MTTTYSEKRIAEEIKLITLGRAMFARLKPVVRKLAIDAITAKANPVDGKNLYVSLLSRADNCWHVHKYPCRDIFPALTFSKETRIWWQATAESLRRILIDDDLLAKGHTDEEFIVSKCVRGEKRKPITYTVARAQKQNVTVQEIYRDFKELIFEYRRKWVQGEMDKTDLPYYTAILQKCLQPYAPAVSFRRIHTSKKTFGFIFVLDSIVYRLQYNGRLYSCPRTSNGPKVEVGTGLVTTPTIGADPKKVYDVLLRALKLLKVHQREAFDDYTFDPKRLRLIGNGRSLRWENNGTPEGNVALWRSADRPKNPPRIDKGMRDQFRHALYQAMTDLEEIPNLTEREYLIEATSRAAQYMTRQVREAWERWNWGQREEFCFDTNGYDRTQLARKIKKKPTVLDSSMSADEYRDYVGKQVESAEFFIDNPSNRHN